MMANRTNEATKKKLKTIRIGDCEICGEESQNLQFAHISPTPLNGQGRGRKERLYDYLTHKDSYALVCSKECNDVAGKLGHKGMKSLRRAAKRKRAQEDYKLLMANRKEALDREWDYRMKHPDPDRASRDLGSPEILNAISRIRRRS